MLYVIVGGAIVVLLLVGAIWWQRLRGGREREDQPMHSVALLLSRRAGIGAEQLRRVAEEVLGRPMVLRDRLQEGKEPPEGAGLIGPVGPMLSIISGDMVLLLHDMEGSYFDDPEAAAEDLPSERLRELTLRHQAWMAIDCVLCPDDMDAMAVMRVLGRMLVALAPEDTVGVFHPDSGRLVPWGAETAEALASEDPLDAFLDYDGVVGVEADDPEMKAAVAEARQTWPEFAEAFARQDDELSYSVKLPFTTADDGTEYMWLSVETIEGETIRGTLGNDPDNVPDLKAGDPVEGRLKDLNDWMILPADPDKMTSMDDMRGGFTARVLLQRQAGRD